MQQFAGVAGNRHYNDLDGFRAIAAIAIVVMHEKGDVMKLVVTVVGVDRVGIIAGVSTVLADHGVNIMSINQTILDGVFNMIMMCETKSEDMKNLTSIQEALNAQGKELGVEIRAQHADIFLSMHRVG